VQSLVATALGAVAGYAFGWGWSAGLVYGLALSVASTVVLVRVLSDNNDLHTPAGHIAVGWLVVEDLFTVLVLVVLPTLFGGDAEPGLLTYWVLAPFGGEKALEAGGLPLLLVLTVVKIGLLVVVTFAAGGRLLPWLLARVAEARSRELFTLTVLVVALGVAVGSAIVFGVSMALGAFLAGMVVGRSDFSLRAATEALPMRDAFAVLFFVSAGMLFDPAYVLSAPVEEAVTLGIVVLGKPLAALLIVRLLGYPFRAALSVSIALAQVGEFTFMLATVGRKLGVLTAGPENALVGAAIVSISINPLLYRLVGPLEAWAAGYPWLWRLLNGTASATPATAELPAQHRAVVVGYGPVGQTLSRLLRENGIEPTVIEMDLEAVRRLREEGLPAVYGDAGHKDTLEAAGVGRANFLVLSSSELRNAEEIIRLARELSPALEVLARCSYLREQPTLRDAGADVVVSDEGEVALSMAERMLRRLGAVPEQIDRERDRVRADLFGLPEIGPSATSRDEGETAQSAGHSEGLRQSE
jgi:CPA2 family monovalent cation:H+ antiporter-2